MGGFTKCKTWQAPKPKMDSLEMQAIKQDFARSTTPAPRPHSTTPSSTRSLSFSHARSRAAAQAQQQIQADAQRQAIEAHHQKVMSVNRGRRVSASNTSLGHGMMSRSSAPPNLSVNTMAFPSSGRSSTPPSAIDSAPAGLAAYQSAAQFPFPTQSGAGEVVRPTSAAMMSRGNGGGPRLSSSSEYISRPQSAVEFRPGMSTASRSRGALAMPGSGRTSAAQAVMNHHNHTQQTRPVLARRGSSSSSAGSSVYAHNPNIVRPSHPPPEAVHGHGGQLMRRPSGSGGASRYSVDLDESLNQAEWRSRRHAEWTREQQDRARRHQMQIQAHVQATGMGPSSNGASHGVRSASAASQRFPSIKTRPSAEAMREHAASQGQLVPHSQSQSRQLQRRPSSSFSLSRPSSSNSIVSRQPSRSSLKGGNDPAQNQSQALMTTRSRTISLGAGDGHDVDGWREQQELEIQILKLRKQLEENKATRKTSTSRSKRSASVGRPTGADSGTVAKTTEGGKTGTRSRTMSVESSKRVHFNLPGGSESSQGTKTPALSEDDSDSDSEDDTPVYVGQQRSSSSSSHPVAQRGPDGRYTLRGAPTKGRAMVMKPSGKGHGDSTVGYPTTTTQSHPSGVSSNQLDRIRARSRTRSSGAADSTRPSFQTAQPLNFLQRAVSRSRTGTNGMMPRQIMVA